MAHPEFVQISASRSSATGTCSARTTRRSKAPPTGPASVFAGPRDLAHQLDRPRRRRRRDAALAARLRARRRGRRPLGGARGRPEFFAVTKRIHNHLHGDRRRRRRARRRASASSTSGRSRASAAELAALVADRRRRLPARPADRRPGPARCGEPGRRWSGAATSASTSPNELGPRRLGLPAPLRRAGRRLRLLAPASSSGTGSTASAIWSCRPSIDAFSPKNQELDPEVVAAILGTRSGSAADGADAGADVRPRRRHRRAGRAHGRDRSRTSRCPTTPSWSPRSRAGTALKDPVGLLACFAEHLGDADAPPACSPGPTPTAVADDPEGAAVSAEVARALASAGPTTSARRVHLVSLPMDDIDENAAMVNAIQRRADDRRPEEPRRGLRADRRRGDVEAAAGGRPSRVGGIQDQIVDGESGLLVDDPRDLEALSSGDPVPR